MRIIFFGSSEYCLPILKALNNNFQLIGAVTKPDSPIGRKQISTPVQFFTPKDTSALSEIKEQLKNLQPDIAVVADFGLIIPKEIFEIPKYKTLNIHFSRLPKLRGASPVQYTILLGEKSAWISVIIMNEGMDTGDIIWQKEYPLTGNETTESLYKKLFNNISLELPEVINQYAGNKLIPKKQNHSEATYTRALTRSDGFVPFEMIIDATHGKAREIRDYIDKFINKNFIVSLPNCHTRLPARQVVTFIERAIRAFSPWPGVWTIVGIRDQELGTRNEEKRLKILKSHIDIDENLLVLDLVQLEGKKPVTWKQLREGYPDVKFTS